MQTGSAALRDARGAAEHITAFINGLDEDAYPADDLQRSAVERQI
jgi:uncharacterized protein with HEPN domain